MHLLLIFGVYVLSLVWFISSPYSQEVLTPRPVRKVGSFMSLVLFSSALSVIVSPSAAELLLPHLRRPRSQLRL